MIFGIYLQATKLAEYGTEVYSTDEMTGIQALKRKYPNKPIRSGSSALHEFEYIRHGTISLITCLRVADSKIQSSYMNNPRNEEDFCNAVRELIAEV